MSSHAHPVETSKGGRRQRAMLLAVTATTLVGVSGIGLWWNTLSEQPTTSDSTPPADAFVGLSTEVASTQEVFDNNNVFWTSPAGTSGLSEALPPVYNPSLLRVAGGFVAPAEDGVIVFDKSLRVRAKLTVPDLGIGTMSEFANSPDGRIAIFTFYDGQSEAPDGRRIVLASESEAHAVFSPHLVQAVTACDDGTARWIEYRPNSNSDPLGPGRAYLATWVPGESVTSVGIEGDFDVAPSAESSLSCGDSNSFVDSPNRLGERVVLEIAEDHNGGVRTIRTQRLPPFPTADGSRFTYTDGPILYTLSANGELSKVDYERGAILYSETLPISGSDVLSATFEDESAYLVTRPDETGNRQSVQRIDLNDPTCISTPIPLAAYDIVSEKSRTVRGDSSYMATMTVLPLRRENLIGCADNQ